LFARRARLPSRPLVAAGMEMLMGGVALLVAGSIAGEWGRLDLGGVSRSSGLALAYLAVFGSIVAFTSYVWLLRNVQTSLVATYAYVNPLVAVVLGSLIADERLTATMIVGGLVIVAAVAVIVTASGGPPRAGDEPPIEERPDLAAQELPA
jgi:drug/metabolite transporter (DMT)-like permease